MKALLILLLALSTTPLHAGDRKSEKNIAYGPHARNVLDVYWNTDLKDAPIVVTIHGGGFTAGDKGYCNGAMQKLYMDLGCVVVSPNYRYRNENGISDCEIDCAMAVAWIQANAKKYGGDPRKILSTGASAGGYLSCRVAYRKKWDWPEEAAHKPDKLNVIGWFGDSPFLPPTAIESVQKGDSPGFVIYGEREHRGTPTTMGHAVCARLEEMGIWNGMVYVPSAGHVPARKVLINPPSRDPKAFTAFEAFLKMVLHGEGEPESGVVLTAQGK